MARIGIDAHVLDGKYQGTRSWLENVLDRLPAVPGADAQEWVIYSADPDATARRFPWPRFLHRRITTHGSIPRLLAFWPAARRRDGLDALVTQYIAPPFAARGFRQIVVIHDLLFESDPQFFPTLMRWRLRLLCRRSARRAAAVLTVSRFSAGEIARRYRVPAARILVAPNAPAALPAPAAEDRAAAEALAPFLLWVGRLEPRKNLPLALARYVDPGVPDAAARMAALIDQALAGALKPDPTACAAHLAQFDPRHAAEALVAAVVLPP